ncbi:FAD-dependent oxidoreductase [Sphingomonas morindae]|uniref:Thioredoxin reductase n=1 Tax=Sphingomonas morindae TaxID=1541170 RepID=A0ABY4XCN4_9SPHN|nr:cyclic nucleotide-binding domain-containing thioredoxin-disulfide reductase [Sphingomonas morindae]USI74655.1 FAD-dependent oxidoreductase [Sphingomonas morindae]
METIGRDLAEMQRVPLAPAHVAALRAVGETVRFAAGEMVAEAGKPADRFVYVEDGEIEVVDPYSGERRVPSTLGPTQFMGEIGLLYGGNWSMPMRAARDTTALVVPRADLLRLMADIPEMSDIIITVLAARRRRQLDHQDGTLVLIGEEADRSIARIAQFAGRNRLPYSSYALGSAEALRVADSCAVPPDRPAVVYGRGQVVAEPTLETVARLLGVVHDIDERQRFDVLIVGGGPAGVAAAVYAGAEGLSALVVEDTAIGGQAGTSSRIENYMGFPTGISGADLVWRGEVQAMKFGSRFIMPRRVAALEPQPDGSFCASLDNGQRVLARAVVIATGVQYRRLPIDRLAEFEGAGVYYAATELEARYCRQGEAIVIGGGNSAGQAAMFLCRTAAHTRLLVRGSSLAASMSSYLSSRLAADPAISVDYGAKVVALHGTDRLEAVTIQNADDGSTRTIDACALFIMVGAEPNTEWLAGVVQCDSKGFILTGEAAGGNSPYATSRPGIFAVGDVRFGSVKRVASAVGEGSVVISKVWEHIHG